MTDHRDGCCSGETMACVVSQLAGERLQEQQWHVSGLAVLVPKLLMAPGSGVAEPQEGGPHGRRM